MVHRVPWGRVLVLGPGNYPLFLAASQVAQAFVAGNTVELKPGSGAGAVLEVFHAEFLAAGGAPTAFVLLPETQEAADAALGSGPSFVILTGGRGSGCEVATRLGKSVTPGIYELSGCDALVLGGDGDADLAARGALFGLRLNGGRTCMAPRRLFVHASRRATFIEALLSAPKVPFTASIPDHVVAWVREAVAMGARPVLGQCPAEGAWELPMVLEGVPDSSPLWREDSFTAVAALATFETDAECAARVRQSPYGLTLAIFAKDGSMPLTEATPAGVILWNDVVLPTVDPRLPFGGTGTSGYGVTRGREGLLSMTRPLVVTRTKSKVRRHYGLPGSGEEALFKAMIRNGHGSSLRSRIGGLIDLIRALSKLAREEKS
jgi:acyl-CoA reductase-like NAD-dependent aldehyde dehydrogenase